MGKIRVLILLPLVVCFSLATAHAQTRLQLGTPIERTLGPGQVHEFSVNLEENNYIQLVVEQRGIDLFVKVFSPSGKNLGEYDTPNGPDGPENVSFVAAAAGTYRISISPLSSDDQTTGRYEIKVLELRKATDDELKAKKNLEEAKAKGIALLAEIESTLPQIKSPHNRIQAQLKAAELLWELDEKRAAKLMGDAIAGIKEFMAESDLSNEQDLMQYQVIAQLRQEVIRVLADRDPDTALSFLQSTNSGYSPYNSSRELLTEESTLELSIASRVSQKDPNKAAQIVRRNLKQAYSYNLIPTASQIAQKNPELARQLGNEIAGKLLGEENLTRNADAANLAMMLLRTYDPPEASVQIVAKDIAVAANASLISEEEYKRLMQKVLDDVLSYTARGINQSPDAIWNLIPGLRSMADQMERTIKGSKAALEKKVTEMSVGNNMIVNPMQDTLNAMTNTSAEAALEMIEKAPDDYREQLYIQLANREVANGDVARARQIISDHITNPYQRRQALANLEQQEMYRTLGKGNVEEALRVLGNQRTPRERANQLTQILAQIGQGQNRATALRQLEQARALLSPSPQAQDLQQMTALFELARTFSNYDVKRSFEIVDPLIDQFNELCEAARKLEGFGGEYYDDDELNMQNGNAMANIVSQMSNVLGELALLNFDRTKTATGKILLPEARLKVYLEMAQQTITGGKWAEAPVGYNQ
jgi:hypothetical protein